MGDLTISRRDFESSASNPKSPDPVLESYFRQQLEQLYAEPSQSLAANDGIEGNKSTGATQGDKEEEYNFRLFTRPSASVPGLLGTSNVPSNDAQRIVLRSPSPARDGLTSSKGGRPDEHFFAGTTSAELAEQYAQAAVSGQKIIDGLQMKWTGMHLPWRVTVIKTTILGAKMVPGDQSQAQPKRRKRSGKKKRIVIRKRFEARSAKDVAARQSHAERMAAEREKRTRKNREKKVKKRRKDKLKKANDVQGPASSQIQVTGS